GRRVEIGLASGRYAITRERSGTLTQAHAEVQDGQRLSLDDDAFVRIDREKTVRRGDSEPSEARVPFVAGLFGPFHSARQVSREPRARVALQAFHLRVSELDGFAFGLGLNEVSGDANGMMWTAIANKTAGTMRGVQWSI